MKFVEEKQNNKVNTNSRMEIFTDNNIFQELNNFSKKGRILNMIKRAYKHTDVKILTINIIGFIFYLISLIGCEKGEENVCVTDFIVQFVLEGILVIINAFIVTLNIWLIYFKKIKWYHIIYIFLFYTIVAQFDYQYTLQKHGGYNVLFLIVFIILWLLLELLLFMLYKLYKKKRTLFYIFIVLIIVIPNGINITLSKIYDCDDFLLGFNDTLLINYPDSGCNFTKPSNCKMTFYYPYLNLSKIFKFNYGSKKNFLMYKENKDKLKNSNKFGIPRITVLGNDENFFDKDFLMRYVGNNIIDMEKENIFNDSHPKPEIEIWFDKKGEGTVHINVTKNETLIEQRKKLENPNSLFENVIIIYIDAVSRNRFKSALPKTSNFIDKFMRNNPEYENLKSFQFLKYHIIGTFTQPNAQPMFYGNSMLSGSGIQITKYFKENGYITSMILDQCVFEIFFDKKKVFTYDVQSENFDHSIMPLFCDQNYFGFLFRGVNSFIKRILYGKETFEYNFEYARQFLNNYKNSRKYMALEFMQAHESTSMVLPFLDNKLYEFLDYLHINQFLKNTSLFFISDHGLHVSTFFAVFSPNNYFHERSLPALFLLIDDNKKIPKEEIYKNQFKFITAYDIYETFYHIIFGNDYEKQNIEPEKRKSLFGFIDESNRNCDTHPEITKSSCKCLANRHINK